MSETIITPGAGTGQTVVAGAGTGHGHNHDRLWEHAILQDTRAEARHLQDRQFDINQRVLESELRNKERIQDLERRVEERHGELKMLFSEKLNQVTDLIKTQKIDELRDKLNSVPRDRTVTIPVTL